MKLFEAIRRQLSARKKAKSNFSLIKEEIDDSVMSSFQVEEAFSKFGKELLEKVHANYQIFLEDEAIDPQLHFIKQNGITGFAVDCYTFNYSLTDWRLLQLHCLNCLVEKNYIIKLKQVETRHQTDNIKTSYKYYLKPSIKLMTSIPSEQLFGNMSLELLLQNGEVFRFLLHANYYSDRNFKKQQNFIDLLNFLRFPI